MKTATQVIEAAFKKIGHQVVEEITPEEYTDGLKYLNEFLNGLNSRGAVFPTVDLGLSDVVPVFDHQIQDLQLALAKTMAGEFGKQFTPQAWIEVTQGETRFINQYIVVPRATPDAGLLNMPSNRRTYTT